MPWVRGTMTAWTGKHHKATGWKWRQKWGRDAVTAWTGKHHKATGWKWRQKWGRGTITASTKKNYETTGWKLPRTWGRDAAHKNTTVSAAMLQPATKTPLWVLPCCSQQQKHHCEYCHVVASNKNTTVIAAMLSPATKTLLWVLPCCSSCLYHWCHKQGQNLWWKYPMPHEPTFSALQWSKADQHGRTKSSNSKDKKVFLVVVAFCCCFRTSVACRL